MRGHNDDGPVGLSRRVRVVPTPLVALAHYCSAHTTKCGQPSIMSRSKGQATSWATTLSTAASAMAFISSSVRSWIGCST